MVITKRYGSRIINFYLLPDLMERIKSSIPEANLLKGKRKLHLDHYYLLKTNSQTASTRQPDEFIDILRSITEPILSLNAQIDCSFETGVESKPRAFELSYRQDSIEIILSRNTASNIKSLFSDLEEKLVLEIVRPKIDEKVDQIRKKTVFIAHSFDQTGKSYAYELIKFLNLLRFEVSTGEGYSPERISKKVKKRLTTQEIVIVIASKKEDATWLIQEATGAAFAEKPLIILVEEGVVFKAGILGDLEFIQFSEGAISSTFIPILEGLQELGYRFE